MVITPLLFLKLECVAYVKGCFTLGSQVIATGPTKKCSITHTFAVHNQSQNHYFLKGNNMLLMLKEMIRRSGTDENGFFGSAYMWRYGKSKDTYTDAYFFRKDGEIPQYVVDYVKHIEAKNGK